MKARSLVVLWLMFLVAASGDAITQAVGQGTAAKLFSAGNAALGVLPQRPTRRQPAPPSPAYFRSIQSREDEGNLSRVLFRNGLTILIEEHTLFPLASIVTLVKGAASSTEARLLAETLFQPFAEGIHANGGRASLEVTSEAVLFHSTGPAENVSRLLDFHAGLLTSTAIEEHSSTAARRLADKSRPERRSMSEVLREDLRRLAGSTAVTQVETGDFSGLELKALHGRIYKPPQVILAISGAALREQVLERAARLYPTGSGAAVKPSAALSGPGTPANLNRGFAYEFQKQSLRAPSIGFVYRIPGVLHQDYYTLMILPHLLARERGSLLHRYLVDENRTALEVDAWIEAGSGSGLFMMVVRPDPQRVDAAETQAIAEIELLKQSGVPQGELQRAKAAFLRERFARLQKLDERAADLAFKEARGRFSSKDEILERVNRIAERDVVRVLGRYFSYPNLSVLESFPLEADDRTFTADSFLETLRLLVPAEVRRRVAEAETMDRAAGVAGTDISSFVPNHLKHELRRTSIMRGPTVFLQERHDVPLVHVGMFFTGGRSLEDFVEAGKTEVLLRSLIHSFRARRGAAAWADLERTGGVIEVVNEAEFFGFSGTVLSPALDPFLQTMLDLIRVEELEEVDVTAARTEVLHLLRTSGEAGFDVEISSVARKILPSSPIVGSRFGTEESLAALDLESVQTWYKDRVSGFHPLILAVGDIPGTVFLEKFIPTLSDASRTAVEGRREERDEEDDENGVHPHLATAQGEVRVAFPGPAKATRDERILSVVAGMLDGEGGRLQAVLREKELGYGFSLVHRSMLDNGLVIAGAQAFVGKEGEVGREVIAQLQDLAVSPIATRDFFNGLVRAISGFFESQQGGRKHLLEHTARIVAGAGADYEKNFQESVREMTREDVAIFARVYFQSDPPVDATDSSTERHEEDR
jgi:predicted Zn-dependent peptidase